MQMDVFPLYALLITITAVGSRLQTVTLDGVMDNTMSRNSVKITLYNCGKERKFTSGFNTFVIPFINNV